MCCILHLGMCCHPSPSGPKPRPPLPAMARMMSPPSLACAPHRCPLHRSIRGEAKPPHAPLSCASRNRLLRLVSCAPLRSYAEPSAAGCCSIQRMGAPPEHVVYSTGFVGMNHTLEASPWIRKTTGASPRPEAEPVITVSHQC